MTPHIRLDYRNLPPFIAIGELAQDNIGPELSYEIIGTQGNDNWYTSDVTINLLAEDNVGGSGVLLIEFQLNDNVIEKYTEPLMFIEENNKQNKLIAISEDKVGNFGNFVELEFRIDNSPPVITSGLLNEYFVNTKIDLQSLFTVKDEISGVDSVKIFIDGVEVSGSYIFENAGNSNVKVVALDVAGNKATYEKKVKIYEEATIKIEPGVINTNRISDDSIITVYIEMDEKHKLHDIDLRTISLNKIATPITDPKLGYVRNPIIENKKEGTHTFMLKFHYREFISSFPSLNDGTAVLRGNFNNGVPFKGTTIVLFQ